MRRLRIQNFDVMSGHLQRQLRVLPVCIDDKVSSNFETQAPPPLHTDAAATRSNPFLIKLPCKFCVIFSCGRQLSSGPSSVALWSTHVTSPAVSPLPSFARHLLSTIFLLRVYFFFFPVQCIVSFPFFSHPLFLPWSSLSSKFSMRSSTSVPVSGLTSLIRLYSPCYAFRACM